MKLFHQFASEKQLIEKSCNPISQKQDFSQYRICAGTQQVIQIFITEQIQWKYMTNFLFKFKKPYFRPISQTIERKAFFLTTPVLSHNFKRVSSSMPKFREIWWSNSYKKTWTDGRTEEHTDLFQRILLATSVGLTSATSVHWHLKVKDMESNVGLAKNYCITINMQKISSIHILILKILQIWGFHELNKCPHTFLTTPA